MAIEKNAGQRTLRRVQAASLVMIKCEVLAQIEGKQVREFHIHTENLSEGGTNVMLEVQLPVQKVVEVRLYLTGRLASVICKGTVAWSRRISPELVKPPLYSTGIKFIDLKEDKKNIIRTIVSTVK